MSFSLSHQEQRKTVVDDDETSDAEFCHRPYG
jgi:hypothetical protein